MRRLLGMLLLVVVACAQSFEVASIKPSPPSGPRGSSGGPGTADATTYTATQMTLLDLITVAWRVRRSQVSSRTPLDRERFDVRAKVAEGATRAEFRAMLRDLLAERFHLRTHEETRDFPVYELTVAKGGLRVRDRNAPGINRDGFPVLPPGKPGRASTISAAADHTITRMSLQQTTIAQFAGLLVLPGGEPIIDRTGLTGNYDFTFEFSREQSVAPNTTPSEPVAPTLFAALQQQLGLQLTPKKEPFPVVVVDAFDKLPTEN